VSGADFHSHLMPGVDDGAASEDDARRGLAALAEDGVLRIVTTPHLSGSVTLRPDALAVRLAELDTAWDRLQRLARTEFPRLELGRGVECMLDVPRPELADARLHLGGTSFVLVEFPFLIVPPRSADALRGLLARGLRPVLAHPERYSGISAELALEWRRAGAYLQVNGASLLGRYGGAPRRLALELLRRGWADYLGSDYHARGRPLVAGYRAEVARLGGEEIAALLCEVNPGRLLDGEPPIPVAPIPGEPSLLARAAAALHLGPWRHPRG